MTNQFTGKHKIKMRTAILDYASLY